MGINETCYLEVGPLRLQVNLGGVGSTHSINGKRSNLLVTSASVVVTSALLVVTMFATRNKCIALLTKLCEFSENLTRKCRSCPPCLEDHSITVENGWFWKAFYISDLHTSAHRK